MSNKQQIATAQRRQDALDKIAKLPAYKHNDLALAPQIVAETPFLTAQERQWCCKMWNFYKELVLQVLEKTKAGKCETLESNLVRKMCLPVHYMSKLLCKQYSPETNAFYNLPLRVTASQVETEASVEWVMTDYHKYEYCENL